MKIVLRYTFTILLLFATLSSGAANHPAFYSKWNQLPTADLITRGNGFFFAKNAKPDSALVCFSIVVNRIGDNPNKKEQHDLCEAYMGMWLVYFFSYFDYAKSFDYLEKSRKVARNLDDMMPRVLLGYGNVYQTLFTQAQDDSLGRKAMGSFHDCFWLAAKEKQLRVLSLAFANMTMMANQLHIYNTIGKEWNNFNRLTNGSKDPDITYAREQYQGFAFLHQGQYERALAIFNHQYESYGFDIEYLRYKFNALENIAYVYVAMGKYDEAVKHFRQLEQYAKTYDMKDVKLEVYQGLILCFQHLGDNNGLEQYRESYFQLRDTLLNYRQLAGLKEVEFLNRMDDINQQMSNMKSRQRIQGLIIAGVAIFAIVILLSFVLVSRKNKQLQSTNETLYKKNMEILQTEEEQRQRHKAEEAAAKASRLANAGTEVPQESKYKNSLLSEADKNNLADSIVNVMENNDEIFSVDFSSSRLAELVNTQYKYVSQVINEKFNINFNGFLNDYRIKEACRRINSGKFDNLTVEALGNSVGFKSRMSFFTAFKHITGLTPSEYIRIAKKNRKA